ncbi:MAG TPA: hypothetical protein EYM84_00820 [Flavobacteriales bacterium]|nr:hypothetical protein [Flavobacteriales bacterium]
MSLKNRIEVFLKTRNKTLADLAGNIGMDLDELKRGITDSSLEVRTLENISKALRIPLYSFFPGDFSKTEKNEIPYYDRRLPDNDLSNDVSEAKFLTDEIKFLSKYLKSRQKQLENLEKGK